MSKTSRSVNAGTRGTVRIIPFFIVLVFALAVYIVVNRLCIDYLYKKKHQHGVATAFLTLFFLFFLLSIATYARTFFVIQRDPGVVPLPPDVQASRDAAASKARRGWCRRRDRERDVEERAGSGGGGGGGDGLGSGGAAPWTPPNDPDSPGLEEFYSKDIFLCEADGRPKWCSACRRWKPERAHHSSELGRCVRKMDHFCPWVGGMVSETSYNFFAQFVIYCSIFCVICLSVGAYCLRQQHKDHEPLNGWALAAIILASIFGSFACGMAVTSVRFILNNLTNIDLVRREYIKYLAVRIPRTTPRSEKYNTIIYPLGADRGRSLFTPEDPRSTRDQQAERKFAILRLNPRENPWDLGFRENWKSVMGNHVLDWLLPLRRSPCCNHESMESDYKYGPLVAQLRKRYGVPDLHASRNGDSIEMQTTRKERSH